MTDDEMLDTFAGACLRAGKSNSGLCIDPMASADWENMQKWRKIMQEHIRKLRADAERATKQP